VRESAKNGAVKMLEMTPMIIVSMSIATNRIATPSKASLHSADGSPPTDLAHFDKTAFLGANFVGPTTAVAFSLAMLGHPLRKP
jgi:hypothetical protein